MIGVGGEVLAPAATQEVRAQPAQQEPRRDRLGREVQGHVDVVRVPDRDAEHREDLGHEREVLGVLRVPPMRTGIERQVLAPRIQVLHVNVDPADEVVVDAQRHLGVLQLAPHRDLRAELRAPMLQLDCRRVLQLPLWQGLGHKPRRLHPGRRGADLLERLVDDRP